MKNSHLVILLLFFICIAFPYYTFSQSDNDYLFEEINNHLYANELELAKKKTLTHYINNSNANNNLFGNILLSQYYAAQNLEDSVGITMAKAENLSRQIDDEKAHAIYDYGLAYHMYRLNIVGEFINSVNKAILIFDKQKKYNYILSLLYQLKHRHKSLNGVDDYGFSDCLQAISYAKLANKNLQLFTVHNQIGTTFLKKYRADKDRIHLDSTDKYFRISYDYANKILDKNAKTRALISYYNNLGNLITFKYPENNGKLSLDNYWKVIKLIGNSDKYTVSKINAYFNIGSVYDNLGKLDSSEHYKKIGMNLIESTKDINIPNLHGYYEGIGILHAKKGNFDLAWEYERKSKQILAENYKKQNEENAKALDVYYETSKKIEKIKNLEIENKLYRRQKILYTIIAFFLLIGSIITYLLFRFRSKSQENSIKLLEEKAKNAELNLSLTNKEKERLALEQELLKRQKEKIQKHALATSIQLDAKREIIDEIKKLNKSNKDITIYKKIKEDQLSDNETTQLKFLIQKVHPNFSQKLNTVAGTKLTNQELKYAIYIYLNMDNQQICSVLNVDSNTVRTNKYRLKQKLKLNKEIDLHEFIRSIEYD